MRQLWAPWRMAYIGAEPTKAGCVFCEKAASTADESNFVLVRGEHCYALLNIFPYNNGHLMIAPYAHLPSILELDPAVLTEMMTMAQRCVRACQDAIGAQGFNIGINQGGVAGAGIADHIHLHVVPRWGGDTNFMPVLADVKVMPDFLENSYRQIRAQLAKSDDGTRRP
ncbi:MAG TPA: HIT domain-containing protein [Ktedonobacterales bacterium]|jgi:ATP adenylyltransferase|nr:HIT domain-containing protein [Ktedonobacterales bacterium]